MQNNGRIKWVAVLAGWTVDVVLSMLVMAIALAAGLQIETGRFFASPGGIVIGLILVALTGIGGFVAGWIAKDEHVLHGVLVGGVGILYLLFVSLIDVAPSFDSIVLQVCATVLAGLGGYMSRWMPVR